VQFVIFFGFRFCRAKATPVSITGIGAARLYLDDSEGGDADHLDASVLRHKNIGAVLELKGSQTGLQIIERPDGLRGARVAPENWESSLQEERPRQQRCDQR